MLTWYRIDNLNLDQCVELGEFFEDLDIPNTGAADRSRWSICYQVEQNENQALQWLMCMDDRRTVRICGFTAKACVCLGVDPL